MLEVTVLAVPDCPDEPVLRDRLAQVLADYPDATVTREVIQDEAGAARYGMHGSPADWEARYSGVWMSSRLPPRVDRLRAEHERSLM